MSMNYDAARYITYDLRLESFDENNEHYCINREVLTSAFAETD